MDTRDKDTGKSNLDVCLADLHSQGYRAVALKLCPSQFGRPVTRKRIYIIGSLELDYSDLQSLASFIAALQVPDSERPSIPLSPFLLADDDPLIDAFYEDALAAKHTKAAKLANQRTAADVDDPKWITERNVPFVTQPRHRDVRWSDPVSATNRWYDLLTDRERQCLATKHSNGVCDLSQIEKRDGNQVDDGCPCITPNGVFFHTGLNRLLVPIERCALQGLQFDASLLCMYDGPFLNDLSGNGYRGPVLEIITIGIVHIYASKWCVAQDTAVNHEQPTTSDVCIDDMLGDGLANVETFLDLCNDFMADC